MLSQNLMFADAMGGMWGMIKNPLSKGGGVVSQGLTVFSGG
jgi:hypothetical protein